MVRAPSLELAASCWTRPPSVSASVDPIFGGGPGGTHDPKISGLVINGKTHGLGHPSFCSLQLGTGIGRDASGSPPPESSVASAVPHSSPSAGQPGEIKTKSTTKKPRENIYIYIHRQMLKKNDQPIFNGSQLSMLFLKLSWVFLPVAPHWQNHLLEAVL